MSERAADVHARLAHQVPALGQWVFTTLMIRDRDDRPILLARGESTLAALIIPIDSVIGAVEDVSSSSLTVAPLAAGRIAGEGPVLSVTCEDPRVLDVFLVLVDGLVAEVASVALEEINGLVAATLNRWRRLLARASEPLSPEATRGIFGELELLWQLRRDPITALQCWGGPRGQVHDFSLPEASLEVKTSNSSDGLQVAISSLDQLTPPDGRPLHLVVHQVREDPQGHTLDESVDRLVTRGGYDPLELERLCGEVGFVPGTSRETRRHRVVRTRAWHVAEDFPGLRRHDLPLHRLTGIRSVRYSLDLSVVLDNDIPLTQTLTEAGWPLP